MDDNLMENLTKYYQAAVLVETTGIEFRIPGRCFDYLESHAQDQGGRSSLYWSLVTSKMVAAGRGSSILIKLTQDDAKELASFFAGTAEILAGQGIDQDARAEGRALRIAADRIFKKIHPAPAGPHHPDCQCNTCYYGPDLATWAFHPNEY